MLYVEPVEFTWDSIISQIPKQAIHIEGLEMEPHVTILFGLHYKEIKEEDVIKVLKTFKVPNKLYLSNPSYFEENTYDVLKYDASNPALHEFNSKIKKFPNTNKFTVYRPHLTIGYLNKGFKVDIQPKIIEVKPRAFVISGFNDDEKIKTYISI
jgi:2'-5' RNA ligase